MDNNVVLPLILLLLFMLASLHAATSIKYSTSDPYSHTALYDHQHYLYHQMSHGFTSFHGHPDSGHTVEEGEFILSSMDAHDKSDLRALLSFRKAITSDPYGDLSNWTAENSDNMCSSWYGIRCNNGRVFSINLSDLDLEGIFSSSQLDLIIAHFQSFW